MHCGVRKRTPILTPFFQPPMPLKRVAASVLLSLLFVPATASAAVPLPRRVLRHLDTTTTTQTTTTSGSPRSMLPRPGQDMTRGAFVASLIRALHSEELTGCLDRLSPSRYELLFRDITRTDPLAPELCTALEAGIIQGYPDGYFRPMQVINNAEAAKVIAKAYGLGKDSSDPRVPWYQPSVNALLSLGITLPRSLAVPFTPDQSKMILWSMHCSQRVWMEKKTLTPLTQEQRQALRASSAPPCAP